jgi:hypothetical protein
LKGFESRQGQDNFSSPWSPDWLWGPLNLSSGYRGHILGGKAVGREADHSSPTGVGVKEFMAWCLTKHRDTFAFTLLVIGILENEPEDQATGYN